VIIDQLGDVSGEAIFDPDWYASPAILVGQAESRLLPDLSADRSVVLTNSTPDPIMSISRNKRPDCSNRTLLQWFRRGGSHHHTWVEPIVETDGVEKPWRVR
jgi:hypothetical protein